MKLALLAGLLLMFALIGCAQQNHDALAECLSEKKVTMFGAFWCPHCANQKEIFGNSFSKINYVECSLPDKSGQTQICKDKEIKGYPTWEFGDGSRVEGEMTLAALAAKAGCAG